MLLPFLVSGMPSFLLDVRLGQHQINPDEAKIIKFDGSEMEAVKKQSPFCSMCGDETKYTEGRKNNLAL